MVDRNLLNSKMVKLTALKEEDIPGIVHWYENTEFSRFYTGRPANPRTIFDIERWFEDVTNAKDGFIFAIRSAETEKFIGYAELEQVNWSNGFSWISIAIGDPSNWSKGYGTEALRLLIDFAFKELNLYRLQLTVFSYNERAVRLYEKLGFQREGCFREVIHRDGNRYDMYLYGLLRHEWGIWEDV